MHPPTPSPVARYHTVTGPDSQSLLVPDWFLVDVWFPRTERHKYQSMGCDHVRVTSTSHDSGSPDSHHWQLLASTSRELDVAAVAAVASVASVAASGHGGTMWMLTTPSV